MYALRFILNAPLGHPLCRGDSVSGACLSEDGMYRYLLWRCWNPEMPGVAFVMLNPSTADHAANDPTIWRCMGFATNWGLGGVLVANLFAYRARHPKQIAAVVDPVGPGNDEWLAWLLKQTAITVAAWGTRGGRNPRASTVIAMHDSWCCIGTNRDGSPKHPLYRRADAGLEPFAKIAK